MRVFVTRNLPDSALAPLRANAEVDVWEGENPPPYEVLKQRTAGCDGLLCLLTDRIDGELLAAAPQLRVVSQMAVGVDNIDLAACRLRNIPVGHTPGVLTETVADLAFALILASARRLVEADRFLRDGAWTTWSPMLLAGPDVHHATLGIIGMGRIGFETARRGAGFRMRIAYTARHVHTEAERELGAVRMDLPDLLATSDFASLHVPLTPETRYLMNQETLAQMKPTAILINTARGGVVDTDALVRALRAGTIAGAGLDVFEEEPLALGHPLMQMRNVTLLPHIGSASVATRTRMAVMAAENLLAGLRGAPLAHAVPAGG
ncbi:MAG: D-glycerate dehydrogenase [Armatimonadetes bacterium]|nr:D-glycerate dehydrogenase [Armatimonadota bacterium]MDE2206318.1 D-glycerate dehydrogenase [Armatimonadota bacterium]